MKKYILTAGLMGLAIFGAPASAMSAELKIMTSLPSLQHPFFVHMQGALESEAKGLGDVTIVAADGQGSSPKQVADIENAIVQGLDGIVISPNDVNALSSAIEDAIDAGIPVVTIDRRVNNVEGILAHVGADNVSGGETQAKFIMDLFPDGATLINLQGQPGSSPAIDRSQGLHNILDPLGDKYKIVAEQTANWNRSEALNVTNAILAGLDTPPTVINTANDEMGHGALEALRAAGIEANIPVVTFDAGPEALISVRDGGLAGTVDQYPGEQSRAAMRILIEFIREGKKPEQAVTLIIPKMITKDNLDESERIGEVE